MNDFLLYHLLGCQNDHIKNIVNFESSEPVIGWDVDCKNVPNSSVKKCKNWHCPSSAKKTSSIKTTLSGFGRARLDFGNCNKNKKGKVKVLLDNQEIATAGKMKKSNVIEFDFNHDSTLEIVGEDKGTTQFNEFEVLSCESDAGR